MLRLLTYSILGAVLVVAWFVIEATEIWRPDASPVSQTRHASPAEDVAGSESPVPTDAVRQTDRPGRAAPSGPTAEEPAVELQAPSESGEVPEADRRPSVELGDTTAAWSRSSWTPPQDTPSVGEVLRPTGPAASNNPAGAPAWDLWPPIDSGDEQAGNWRLQVLDIYLEALRALDGESQDDH